MKHTQQPNHWPMTVATAAPKTPSFGAPSRPKMRMGSRMMLTMAPDIWLSIWNTVRPVTWMSRSRQIWKNMPRLNTRHTRR